MDILLAALASVSSLDVGSALSIVKPLMITLFSLAGSAIFILQFYEFISTRDVFQEGSRYHKASKSFKKSSEVSRLLGWFVTVLEYLFLFPLVVFFWAGVFFVIIVMVSEIASVSQVLLVSISIVGAIRICAYYRRKIAEDLSKLLPLALISNFLIQQKYISLGATFEKVKLAFLTPKFQRLALHYFLFLILLELVLRVIRFLWSLHERKVRSGEIVKEDFTEEENMD